MIEMIAKMRTSRSRDGSAWKCIDTEGVKVNKKNERVQESSEKIKRQMQSSIQNVMPAVARNVQVLGVLAVNSSDEFQMKSSKTTAKNCKI